MSLEGKSPDEIQALAELAQSLHDNPKTHHGFMVLNKIANPQLPVPEVDIPAGVQGVLKPLLERMDKQDIQHQERETRERIKENRTAAIKKTGITEEEMTEVEKLMVERGIPDHTTAAEFYTLQKRSAEPTAEATAPRRPGTMPYGAPEMPKLETGQNMRQYTYHTAYDVIDQLRGRRPVQR